MNTIMQKMTDIAKDYLNDFEVLTEARKEFEQQLNDWWEILLSKFVLPALEKEQKVVSADSLSTWENQSNPGMFQCRIHPKQEIYIQIADPRTSERGCYTVSLFAGSQPSLKALNKQQSFVVALEKLLSDVSGHGQLGIKRFATELASADIPINPDQPSESATQVREMALRFFAVLVAQYSHKKDDLKS